MPSVPKIKWVNEAEMKVIVNRLTQKEFNCSLEEFLDGFLLGSYDIDGPQHSQLVETLMLVSTRWTKVRKTALPNERRAILRDIRESCGPDLVHKAYRSKRPLNAHKTWGCCYVASEALFYSWAKVRGFKPHYVIMADGGKHWFLKNRDGVILDPTVAQFKTKPAYSKAKPCGFQQQSTRCQILMKRVWVRQQGGITK